MHLSLVKFLIYGIVLSLHYLNLIRSIRLVRYVIPYLLPIKYYFVGLCPYLRNIYCSINQPIYLDYKKYLCS